MGNDRAGLALIRQALENQRQAALAQMDTAASDSHTPAVLTGLFGGGLLTGQHHGQHHDEMLQLWEVGVSGEDGVWDSGADTEVESHSEVTNMSDSD